VQWAKDIRAATCPRDSEEWCVRRDILSYMLNALGSLPISVGILKKTKIGKAINQIFKA